MSPESVQRFRGNDMHEKEMEGASRTYQNPRTSPHRNVPSYIRQVVDAAARPDRDDRRRRSLNLASLRGGSTNITSRNRTDIKMYAGIPVLALARKAINMAAAIYIPIVKGLSLCS